MEFWLGVASFLLLLFCRVSTFVSCLENIQPKSCRMEKLWKKWKIKIDLPENVAHIVAINAENSTVMAPVSLYAITCVKIISPIANRLYVPDAIISLILCIRG